MCAQHTKGSLEMLNTLLPSLKITSIENLEDVGLINQFGESRYMHSFMISQRSAYTLIQQEMNLGFDYGILQRRIFFEAVMWYFMKIGSLMTLNLRGKKSLQ